MSDPEFLARFRAGDEQTLNDVYWAYCRQVERICRADPTHRALGGDVADAVHEVFVRAFAPSARLSYDGIRPYEAYLFTIARNVLVDWARRRTRELPVELNRLEAAPAAEDEGDAPSWADRETMKCVTEYLAGLPEPLRALHRCRFAQGMSQVQAALELGWSRQELRTREKRLRAGLEQALARAGIEWK
jgi:RNA polymerase sigma factor (sigma-70 family)